LVPQLLRKRPISPDVINTHAGAPARHYDFPITAISSVVNRVTGAGLSVGAPLSPFAQLICRVDGGAGMRWCGNAQRVLLLK
jgi:hypothetical protein